MVNKPPPLQKQPLETTVIAYTVSHYYGNKMFNSLQFRKLLTMVLEVIINHKLCGK